MGDGGQCTLNGAPSIVIGLWSGNRQPQCELRLNDDNPYNALAKGTTYARGAQFSRRSDIIEANKNQHNPFVALPMKPKKVNSDVPDLDVYTTLAHSTAMPDPEDDIYYQAPLTPPSRLQDSVDYANIDHIIPRVDIYGCECGTNSPLNALVLSRDLNIYMSNDMNNAERIEILRQFTNYNAVFGPPQ